MRRGGSLVLWATALVWVKLATAGTELRFARQTLNTEGQQWQKLEQFQAAWAQNVGIQQIKKDPKYFIVQFKDSVGAQHRAWLKHRGFKIYRYLPDDAFVVSGNLEQLFELTEAQQLIQTVLPYAGQFKLGEDLPVISLLSIDQSSQLLVSAFSVEDIQAIWQAVRFVDPLARILGQNGRYLAISTKVETLIELELRDDVEFVQSLADFEFFQMQASELVHSLPMALNGDYKDLSGYETGTKLMRFESAWSKGYRGAGEVVGVADTGLDSGNTVNLIQDVQGAVLSGASYASKTNDWSDPMGHGTHVAGSIASRGSLSGGAFAGGAPSADLVVQGLWSKPLQNLLLPKDITLLFKDAYKEGARIHSNSWGNPRNLGAYDAFAQAVDEYLWTNKDILVVFAAGNSGVDANRDGVIDEGSVSSPGTAKNVLTVGASKNKLAKGGIQAKLKDLKAGQKNWAIEPLASSRLSDNPQGLAPFSSRGPTKDGRLKPEIVAPGTNIVSLKSQQPGVSEMWGAYNKYYTYAGGTSMATPLTSGAAALAREILRKEYGLKTPSAALVKSFLMLTAEDLYPGQFGLGKGQEMTQRPNVNEGYGRVNVEAMVGGRAQLVDETVGLKTGERWQRSILLNAGQTIEAVLAYTDDAGSPTAATQLVNDLDLEIVTPAGQILNFKDSINNSNFLKYTAAADGQYSLQVRAIKVPSGQQSFALSYSVQ